MSTQTAIPFTPTPDVAVILQHLLDVYERRDGAPRQVVRVKMEDIGKNLPGYNSQTDPLPRVTANEQLEELAQHGWVYLTWQPAQSGHLLEAVALEPAQTS